MANNKQRFHIEVQFNYTGEVFDGDPTDLDELAALESYGLEVALKPYLEAFFDDVENIHIRVGAVRDVNK